jgi:hypothetical protein
MRDRKLFTQYVKEIVMSNQEDSPTGPQSALERAIFDMRTDFKRAEKTVGYIKSYIRDAVAQGEDPQDERIFRLTYQMLQECWPDLAKEVEYCLQAWGCPLKPLPNEPVEPKWAPSPVKSLLIWYWFRDKFRNLWGWK